MKHRCFFCTVFAFLLSNALADDLLVYTTADSGAGSLRQAILDNKNLGGGNTIIFSNVVTGTITLTTGELFISNNVTILGPGARLLAVDGNHASRVFEITNATVSISGLTLTNGLASGSVFPANAGGSIYIARNSSVTLSDCTISGNSAAIGGGVNNAGSSTLTVNKCSVSGNFASDSSFGDGGGIRNDGTLTVSRSTLSGNSATRNGGGIASTIIPPVTISASTFSGNSATTGGGIYGQSFLTISASTFSGNSATNGGGINWAGPGGTTATVSSSIVASNAATFGPDLGGINRFTSGGYNLIGNVGGVTAFTNATDQIGIDPMLGPLADNGGPTMTMALRVGSPAIDKGNSFGLTTDQRGQSRPYDNPDISNASGGDGTDIGAYEASELRVVNAQQTGNHLRLDFTSLLGTNYEVQSRSDLTTGSWGTLSGSTPGNGGIASTTVSNAFSQPKQFYRIHPVP